MDIRLKKYYKKGSVEAGCDEAGRGSLAGPIFAAAVILPEDNSIPGLNDSKKLSENNREELRLQIEKTALSYSVAYLSNQEVDTLNIFKASMAAMHKAIKGLRMVPDHLLIDGHLFFPYEHINHTCIIKGDAKYASIAAASILAKTYRDEFMSSLHDKHEQYDWKHNKGYGTQKHKEAIKTHGISEYHRKSFRLYDNQMKLNF
jgi:ribonuclease HII